MMSVKILLDSLNNTRIRSNWDDLL